MMPRLFSLTFLILSSAVWGTEELVHESSSAPAVPVVPESTAAIILGGLLWFLLLRKRA